MISLSQQGECDMIRIIVITIEFSQFSINGKCRHGSKWVILLKIHFQFGYLSVERRINPTDRELSPISIDLSLADPSSAEPLQQTQSPFVFDSCEKVSFHSKAPLLSTWSFFRNFSGMISSIPMWITMRNSKYLVDDSFRDLFVESILARTGQIGAFLIRPQSKKSNSSDQQYVR